MGVGDKTRVGTRHSGRRGNACQAGPGGGGRRKTHPWESSLILAQEELWDILEQVGCGWAQSGPRRFGKGPEHGVMGSEDRLHPHYGISALLTSHLTTSPGKSPAGRRGRLFPSTVVWREKKKKISKSYSQTPGFC